MAVLTVGSGKQFSTITAAITAAQNGDTIRVDAGTYTNQYATITKNLTFEGVGGMVKMVSTGLIPNNKAIFIANGNITFNDFEFTGAKVFDHNGAGIRFEGGNLVLNDCYFHDNEDGLLTIGSNTTATLTVNDSEFAHNGFGDSQTHNIYVGKIANFTVNNSYFHDVNGDGNEIKSRALNTTIQNSRIYDGPTSIASYSIDLSNGGNALIQNNVIEQGPLSENQAIIEYGAEGNLNPGTNFQILGNTITNHRIAGAIAVWNKTTATAQISNNKFFGLTAGQIALGTNTQAGNQFLTSDPSLDTTHPWLPGALTIQLLSDTGISSTDLITSNAAIAGSGAANAVVTIKEGGAILGTATASNTGAWSFARGGSGRRGAYGDRDPDRSCRHDQHGDAEIHAR